MPAKERTYSTLSRERAKAAFWTAQPKYIKRDRSSSVRDIAGKPGYRRIDDAHSRHAIASWVDSQTSTMYIWSTADDLYFPSSSESILLSCMELEEIEENLFLFDKVRDAKYMFFGCGALKTVTITGMKEVMETDNMFANCTSLSEITMSDCGFDNLLSSTWMFRSCSALERIDFSCLKADKILSVEGMFSECSNLRSVKMFASNNDPSDFTVAKILSAVGPNAWSNSTLYEEFSGLVEAKTPGPIIVDWIKKKNRSRPKCAKLIVEPQFSRALYNNSIVSVAYAFAGCERLEELDMDRCQLIGVNQYRGLFDRCGLSADEQERVLKRIPLKERTK